MFQVSRFKAAGHDALKPAIRAAVFALIGGALTAGQTGCNVANTYEAKDGRKAQPIDDQRVTWNWDLNWSAYVTGLYELKKPNELMRVDFEVHNRGFDPRAFRYKFEWFDENGLAIPTDGNWREGTIAAGEFKTFRGVAPTLNAIDFRLSLTSKQ